MKIITTFTLFFMLNSFLYCQNNWEFSSRIERNNFYLLEGNIDNKYPIRMYLEETWDYCGNGNAKWDPRIVKGWYERVWLGRMVCIFANRSRLYH